MEFNTINECDGDYCEVVKYLGEQNIEMLRNVMALPNLPEQEYARGACINMLREIFGI